MITENADFEKIADRIRQLSEFDALFESCGKLIADTLVAEGKVFSVGDGITRTSAQQLSSLLAFSPEQQRPPLPAIYLDADSGGLQRFQALGAEGDFLVFFGGPSADPLLDSWLDTCLSMGITSVLINPDINRGEPTDKALEIRLEYRSITDYLTIASALCSFLTKSIEMQLFGRQA